MAYAQFFSYPGGRLVVSTDRGSFTIARDETSGKLVRAPVRKDGGKMREGKISSLDEILEYLNGL